MLGLDMKYFVLKPKGSDRYALASREAMIAYANVIKKENSQLYIDLIAWATEEHKEAMKDG